MAMDKTLQAIHDSARNFDLYDEAGEAVATKILDDMAGEADFTPDEDQFGCNGFDGVPLSGAIDTARLAQVPAFQQIHAAIKDLHAQCVEKSKDEKQSADYRALHHAKGLGVEQVLGVINAALEESEARLKAATPAERRAMGSEANTFISDLIAPVAASQTEAESPKRVINVGPSSLDEPNAAPAIINGERVGSLPGMRVVSATAQPRSRN